MNLRKEKRRKSRAVPVNPHEDWCRPGYDVRGRVTGGQMPAGERRRVTGETE